MVTVAVGFVDQFEGGSARASLQSEDPGLGTALKMVRRLRGSVQNEDGKMREFAGPLRLASPEAGAASRSARLLMTIAPIVSPRLGCSAGKIQRVSMSHHGSTIGVQCHVGGSLDGI